VAHIQSAGCKAQRKSVIGAHDRCWKSQQVLSSSRNAANEGHDDGEQENDQEVERDELHLTAVTDPYKEVILGRRRPDSVVVDVGIGIMEYEGKSRVWQPWN